MRRAVELLREMPLRLPVQREVGERRVGDHFRQLHRRLHALLRQVVQQAVGEGDAEGRRLAGGVDEDPGVDHAVTEPLRLPADKTGFNLRLRRRALRRQPERDGQARDNEQDRSEVIANHLFFDKQ